ncbi:MAG: hypothetical protein QXL94_04470, partial [Candidatus Parvarchaeum sp.]
MGYSPPLAGYPPIPLSELAALVASFNGRTGAVLPASGDYTIEDVGFASGFPTDTPIPLSALAALVASFNGRTGAVVPASGDYTAAMVGALSGATVLTGGSSGTYDLPDGVSAAIALVVGAGGGSGAGDTSYGSGGGGSGGSILTYIVNSVSYSVGVGGSGGSSSNFDG